MALGLCCQWLIRKNGKPKNILVSRVLQKGRFERGEYTNYKIKRTYIDNLENLLEVIPTVVESGIRVMRISSAMFPLFDMVDRDTWDNETTLGLMKQIGDLSKEHQLRITTHPGQFVVLNSLDNDVVKKAIAELDFHGWLFDKMGFDQTPYYAINIHGGKSNQPTRLAKKIEKLSEGARKRLTLENCEMCYGVSSLQFVSKETGVPICYDSHHHAINPRGLSSEEAMEAAIETWPEGIRPLTHISNSKPEFARHPSKMKRRAHSDYLRHVPEHQRVANNDGRIDIDIEAKMKNFAIFDAVRNLDLALT